MSAAIRKITREDKDNNSRTASNEGLINFDCASYLKKLEPEHEALAGLGVDSETLREWKAGFASSGIHRGRLALPITDKVGGIIGYIGLALKGESPALTLSNLIDPRRHIFGVDRVTSEPLSLVRDPLEVLKAYEVGRRNTVCLLTEEVSGIQLDLLAELLDERQCGTLSIF